MPALRHQAFPIGSAPIVVGAMGGSGTRVIVPFLQLAGIWMGNWICQKTQDAMATRYLLQTDFDTIYTNTHVDDGILKSFSRLIQGHRRGMPDPHGTWGWKNPRSMWIIPFLSRLYPQMKFIHIIRDGRDMALTRNHNLLHKNGAQLLHDPDCHEDPVRSNFRLWAMGNRIAADDGQQLLGSNYLRIDYDELCLNPRQQLSRLYEHIEVNVNEELIHTASSLITPSTRCGFWKQSAHTVLHEPDTHLQEALDYFGYT